MTAGAYLNSLRTYYVPTGILRISFLKPDYVPADALRIYSPEYDIKGCKLMTGNFAILSHFLQAHHYLKNSKMLTKSVEI